MRLPPLLRARMPLTVGAILLAAFLLAGRDYAEIDEIAVAEGALTFAGRLKELP